MTAADGPSAAAFPPVVDLAGPDAATLIDQACQSVGFFQIENHGIAPATINRTFAVIDDFFTQPLAEKLRWTPVTAEIERGYSARGSEGLAYSLGIEQPPDLFEAFTVARDEYPADDPVFLDDRHHFFEPNLWPDNAPNFRTALNAYYLEAQRVAHRLTTLFAEALGLEPDFFEARTAHSCDTLRVNYFEGRPGEHVVPDQFGIGPHTDYGILTVLLTDDTPGLEVLAPDGTWRAVERVPGALIVNVSDLLAQWTNDRWRSTLHRVQAIRAVDGRPVIRRSLPFFHEGDYDMVVACLPTCCSEDNPPRYPPVHAGEHVAAKVLSGRLQETVEVSSTLGDRVAAI